MIVAITKGEEYYPVHWLADEPEDYHTRLDLTEEQIAFLKDAEEKFNKAQDLLSDALTEYYKEHPL